MTCWPPKTLHDTYKRYETNAVWYSGDRERLLAHYRGDTSMRGDGKATIYGPGGRNVSTMRWFWGLTSQGDNHAKIHLPLAGDIASTSSDLLFAEPPKFTVERVNEFGLHAALLEAGEIASAFGDVYLVATWDKDLRECPWVRVVHPDAVVPSFTKGVLTSIIVWTALESSDDKVWRHLEHHEKGVIRNELWLGTSTDLGAEKDLSLHPDVAGLMPVLVTGVPGLTAWHCPNILPNRVDRGSRLGRPDYSPAVLGLFDQLDETWSGLHRDFRLAKTRVVLTEDALRPAAGGGVVADMDRELYVPLNVEPGSTGAGLPVSLIQPIIRVQEHLDGCLEITNRAISSCGYSPSSFGADVSGGSAKTAEEIRDRQRMSYLTRGKKTLHWPLKQIAATLLMLDSALNGGSPELDDLDVEFGDQIAESILATANTLNLLSQAQAASVQTMVSILHPEWRETDVLEETDRIRSERGLAPVADPLELVHTQEGMTDNAGNERNRSSDTDSDGGDTDSDGTAGGDTDSDGGNARN